MTDVFLSHCSKDRAAAEAVQKSFTARGFDVFWDQEIPPGTDWDTWIRSKLAGAKVVVVLWSHASIASQNVRHEAMIARDAQKIVPVMLEALAPEDFPMGLYLVQGVQLLDWRNTGAKGYEQLAAEVAARLGKPVSTPKAAAKGVSPVILFGLVGLLAAVGVGLYFWGQSHKPGAALLAQASPGASAPPARNLGPKPADLAADGLARRMLGHWRIHDDRPCSEGSNVTLENGRLIFTTPGSRYVHAIDSDTLKGTRSHVLEPASDAGHLYVFMPEYVATAETRNFNLVVLEPRTGEKNTWSPCELP